MPDQTTFEARLADAYERFVALAPVTIDARAMADAAATASRPMVLRRISRAPTLVRLALVAALLVAAVAGAMLIAGRLGPIVGPMQNGLIVLNGMIFEADGTPKALSIPSALPPADKPVENSCSALSPDGRWLAYLAGGTTGGLAISRLDGADGRYLWTGAFREQVVHQVLWSADSSSVLATRIDTGGAVIGHVDARPAAALDWGNGEFLGTIALSHDGLRVAQIDGSAIVIRQVDGSVATTISGVADGPIAWSPDGAAIAYVARDVSRGATVHVVEADGTADRVVSTGAPDASITIAWSADGAQLVSVEMIDIPGPIRSRRIMSTIVDRTGAVLGRVAPFEATGQTLLVTWSPDGKDLLYTIGGGPQGQSPLIVQVDDGSTRTIDINTYFYPQCVPGWGPVVP